MAKLNIHEYLAKYKAEFPDNKVYYELPMPTDAISVVSDPGNWQCYPENVVRIYLTRYKEEKEYHLIGVGDFKHPTVCTNVYESLDEACSLIANRPDEISIEWLLQNGFCFLESPLSKPFKIN
jgi:hypothetical protein